MEEGTGHSCPASDPSQLKAESTRFVQLSVLLLGTSPWQDPRGQAHTSVAPNPPTWVPSEWVDRVCPSQLWLREWASRLVG